MAAKTSAIVSLAGIPPWDLVQSLGVAHHNTVTSSYSSGDNIVWPTGFKVGPFFTRTCWCYKQDVSLTQPQLSLPIPVCVGDCMLCDDSNHYSSTEVIGGIVTTRNWLRHGRHPLLSGNNLNHGHKQEQCLFILFTDMQVTRRNYEIKNLATSTFMYFDTLLWGTM